MAYDLPYISRARLGDHLDQALMFTFFAAFCRFEYALKMKGFRRKNAAEADWDAYAREIDQAFEERCASDDVLKTCVDELLNAPPKKQAADRAWMKVEPQGNPKGAPNLLLLVRRVRNNLFHGGKAQRHGTHAERDNQLVRNSLVVLDRALECHPDLLECFVEV